MSFGEKLKQLLEVSGMKQGELGERIGASGRNVSNWVVGKSIPRVGTLLKICKVFDVTPNEMLGFDEATIGIKMLENRMEKLNDDFTVLCEQILYVQKQLNKLKGA